LHQKAGSFVMVKIITGAIYGVDGIELWAFKNLSVLAISKVRIKKVFLIV